MGAFALMANGKVASVDNGDGTRSLVPVDRFKEYCGYQWRAVYEYDCDTETWSEVSAESEWARQTPFQCEGAIEEVTLCKYAVYGELHICEPDPLPAKPSAPTFVPDCCPPPCTCPDGLPDVIMVYFLRSSVEYYNDGCTDINTDSGVGFRTKNNGPVALTRVGETCVWRAEDPEEGFVESNLVEYGIPEEEPWDPFEEPVTLELELECIDALNDIGKWGFSATASTLNEGWDKLFGATPFGFWSNVETCNLLGGGPGNGSIKNWDIMEVT
jgi:hypothetical protein